MVKAIPKTTIGLNRKQKEILKSYIGAIPCDIDMSKVREWVKYGDQSETNPSNKDHN